MRNSTNKNLTRGVQSFMDCDVVTGFVAPCFLIPVTNEKNLF